MRKQHLIDLALIALSTLFMAMACEGDYDYDGKHLDILIENKSDKEIIATGSITYPDTTKNMTISFAGRDIGTTDVITSNYDDSWSRLYCQMAFFEDAFGSKIKSDTLMVYIFDVSKLDANSSVGDALIQRYDLSLPDLQQLNWKLTYPPDISMKYVKMWPPYNGQ